MNNSDRILTDPAILMGKPVVRGTRISVSLILNLLAHGYRFADIRNDYPQLSDDDIRAAVLYAARRMDREYVLTAG